MRDCESVVDEARKILINFYRRYGRVFPWRETTDPYRIMVAEMMLQRTRPEQVVNSYSAFIEKFPSPEVLAQASLDEISKYIYHLGLSWRSKSLLMAAQYVTYNLKGDFPRNRRDLKKIPGVGDYIAGVILIAAFGKREYAVDSNVARFINRLCALKLRGELRRNSQIILLAKRLFNCNFPKEILFGLIDFGALVCRPRNPKCGDCPLKHLCKSCGIF